MGMVDIPVTRLQRAAAASLPAGMSTGELPLSHTLVLILSLLVLLLAGVAITAARRREREGRDHLRALHEREQRLQLSLWASNEYYWQYDLDTRELEETRVTAETGGEFAVRVIPDRQTRIHEEDAPIVRERLIAYLRGETPYFQSDHRLQSSNGGWQWVRTRGRAIAHTPDGRVRLLAGTARNIDAVREMEGQHRIAAEVMRSMAESVLVVDAQFRFVTINPAFTRISGYDADDVLGKDAGLLNSTRHDADFYASCRAAMAANAHWVGEMWQVRKDGREFLCEMQATAMDDPVNGTRMYVLVAEDITERRRIERELRYLANYDPLTNLPNRTLLSERLSHAIVQARRQNGRLALLFLDLDHFKDINDSQGHATGDRILRATAQRLREVAGEGPTIARIGGDEFTILLDVSNAPEAADRLAQALIDAFDAPLQLDGRHEFIISPSIGISLFPDHAQVPTDLLKHADTAMYRAKASGRRAFARYSHEMDADIRHRASLVAALRRAIERDELYLVFQPQLGLADRRLAAVEALLRWSSKELGEVAPSQFIPLAEENGLIVPIGEWVLREACRTLAAWRQAGVDNDLVMSVNVSALQLQRADFAAAVKNALAEHGLPPEALELELTETVLMAQPELASERLQAFREMGVSIAVDDFGTGYSSLAYLHRLPINTLKIDKAFIDGLGCNPDNEDTAITTTIIAMARTLGLLVVGEGVESPEQLDFLQHHGCDMAQGYHVARPLPADACLRTLLENAAQARALRA